LKILIINKSDTTGGAAIAARRLKDALQANNHEVKMLVQEKLSNDASVFSTTTSKFKKYYNLWLFILERLYFLFFEKSKDIRFTFSPAIAGEDISKHPLVKEADVIHVHWFNQGYLSLKSLKKLLKLNKKIVWTLHDMWAFTGGCHYAGDCNNYENSCGNCKFLKKPGQKDLSSKILKQKQQVLKDKQLQIVTCSNWLANKARTSSLLKNIEVKAIPNPIDINVFKPGDKSELRNQLNLPQEKKLILFGAANIMDERKGLKYLVEALKKLKEKNAQLAEESEILLFGKSNEEFLKQLPLKVNNLGPIFGEQNIAKVYAASDVFVLPSLEDNLPNTIMESLACETPVVAFDTGGIPEMIEHQKNGYLSEYKSVDDLLNGLIYVLTTDLLEETKRFNSSFLQKNVAQKYFEVYKSSKQEAGSGSE
jgi:glycosyltransferase involved in cell wall biosynthesis